MDLAEFQAGGYEAQYEYRSFVPATVRHPWVIADPEISHLLSEAAADLANFLDMHMDR